MGMEELKKRRKGGKVKEAQRLKTVQEGVKTGSDTVMMSLWRECVQQRAAGVCEFPTESVCAKTMKVFEVSKVWTHTHTAMKCKEKRRCAGCGGDHEDGKCAVAVEEEPIVWHMVAVSS